MSQPGETFFGKRPSAHIVTTLLAGSWGFAFSYSCFRCLFSADCPRGCYIALIPLIAVWATLERKRWGRLALLGLSAMTLGLFLVYTGLLLAGRSELTSAALLHLPDVIPQALNLFSDHPRTTLLILLLAAASLLWLCRPAVKEEFEKGKQSFLRTGQRVIAVALVILWSLLVMSVVPLFAAKSDSGAPLKTTKIRAHL